MRSRNLGDIELHEYVRMVRRQSPRKTGGKLLALVICLSCFGAGYAARLGKGSRDMSFTEAMELVNRAPRADWEQEQAVVAIGRNIHESLDRLAIVARSDDPSAGKSAEYSNITLFYAGRTAVSHLKELLTDGVRQQKNERYLMLLRESLKE